jgi:peroxiredoxin
MDPIIRIGEETPKFELADLTGKTYSLTAMQGHIVVLNFWSAECDWCSRIDQELMSFSKKWGDQVAVWWIASNSNEEHALIRQAAIERHISAVLIDADHKVADLYEAQTTPHFFIVDNQGILRYRGAWDDVSFRQRTATRAYVPEVIEALTANKPLEVTQTHAYGCTIVRY